MAVRADGIASTAPAGGWIPAWFPQTPVLPPPTGAVIRAATVEELHTEVVNNLVHGEILLEAGDPSSAGAAPATSLDKSAFFALQLAASGHRMPHRHKIKRAIADCLDLLRTSTLLQIPQCWRKRHTRHV